MAFKLKEDKPCRNCGTMLHVRDCKHLTCEAGSGRCLSCNNDRAFYDYLDSPNHEEHDVDRCRWAEAVWKLAEMIAERDAWKARTREYVREYMCKDPDLRAREIADENGVLEAELDLATTRLEMAKEEIAKLKTGAQDERDKIVIFLSHRVEDLLHNSKLEEATVAAMSVRAVRNEIERGDHLKKREP
jgi:hypothetical protein